MTKDEIRLLLAQCLDRESIEYDVPTKEDWQATEDFFNTTFPQDFRVFIDLMSEFSFPGDIYNVKTNGRNNGNDDMVTVYEIEQSSSEWPKHLIPFYGIGNSDYFALDSEKGENSAVYYRFHENGFVEKYASSFEAWLKRLPSFLNGE